MVSIIYLLLLATSNSVSAQNMTNQTMNGTNMPNITTSDASTGPTKLHLQEGILALEKRDKAAAMIHLNAAQQAIASNCSGQNAFR